MSDAYPLGDLVWLPVLLFVAPLAIVAVAAVLALVSRKVAS